jgi:hypothetical protein
VTKFLTNTTILFCLILKRAKKLLLLLCICTSLGLPLVTRELASYLFIGCGDFQAQVKGERCSILIKMNSLKTIHEGWRHGSSDTALA